MATALMLAFWRDPVGAFISLVYFCYGAGLFWLARRGPDALVALRLDGAVRSLRSLQISALALCGSALTDLLVSLDIAREGGVHAGTIVAVVDGLVLLALGAAASAAGASAVMVEPEDAPETIGLTDAPVPEDVVQTAGLIDAAMLQKVLYRDAELNLGRLARRLRPSTRSVSNAINRVHGMSVSHYVNTYRVKAACSRLNETDESVGAVMFEAGFLTKSNFNREFLRVTGTSPSAWRQKHRRLPG